MRKFRSILVILLVAILVTGCGNSKSKVIKCTNTRNTSTIKYTANYEVTTDGKKVSKVKTTEVIKSDDADYLTTTKETLDATYKAASIYGGYDYNITINGDTLTSNCTIDYTKFDAKKFLDDNGAANNLVDENNNIKLDSLISMYETLGATCDK